MNNNISIGVCDDENSVHTVIDDYLKKYSDSKKIPLCTLHFKSANQLLNNKEHLDVLFLDIEMPDMDGIEAGRILREHGKNYKIIMLTGRLDRMRDAFQIEPSHFIDKPIEEEALTEALNRVIFSIRSLREVCVFKDGIQYNLSQRDILYIEANKASSRIFTVKEEYRSENTLIEWETILDDKIFFRKNGQ